MEPQSIHDEADDELHVVTRPIDYYVMWNATILREIQEGRGNGAIENALLKEYPDTHPADVQIVVQRTRDRWERYLKYFAETGKPGRPRALDVDGVMTLATLMKVVPTQCGYKARHWTVAMLRDALYRWGGIVVSDSTVRRVLSKLKFFWHFDHFVRDTMEATTGADDGWGLNEILIPADLNFAQCLELAQVRATVRRINQSPADDPDEDCAVS